MPTSGGSVESTQYVARKLLLDKDLERHWRDLQDPFGRALWFGTDNVVQDADLWTENTAILGEAQSGKSSVLRAAFRACEIAFHASSDSPRPVFVDLGIELEKKLDVERLFERLNERYQGNSIRLFIDSVDEPMRIDGRKFLQSLKRALIDYFPSTPLVIASRRWALGTQDLGSLSFGIRVLTTDLIDQNFYAGFFTDRASFKDFLTEVEGLGLRHFLGRALDGIGLVRAYQSDGKLPSSRSALFKQRLKNALRAASSAFDERSTPSSNELEVLARRLAILATLSNRISWTSLETREELEMLSEGAIKPVTLDSLLGTSLFKQSTDGMFAFARDEDRERLAALGLQHLRERKLKILVGQQAEGIPASRRGLAQQLAILLPSFLRHLTAIDPISAVFTEQLATDQEEELLTIFFEFVVSAQLVPWQKLPPTDEQLQRVLYFRRPPNVDDFLRPWLLSSDSIALAWATLAATVWKTSTASNEQLLKIALKEGKRRGPAREHAVEAICQTEDRACLLKLGRLHWSDDSEARGNYMEAFLKQRQPPARRVIALFRGGVRENLVGKMVVLAHEMADHIPDNEISEAFRLTVTHRKDFDELFEPMLKSILAKATEAKLELGVDLLTGIASEESHRNRSSSSGTLEYLSASPTRLVRFISYVLKAELDDRIWYHALEALATIEPQALLHAIPNEASVVQDRVERLARAIFQHHRSYELKAQLEQRFSVVLPAMAQGTSPSHSDYLNNAVDDILNQHDPDLDDPGLLAIRFCTSLGYRSHDPVFSSLSAGKLLRIRQVMETFWESNELEPLEYNPDHSWREKCYERASQRRLFIFGLAVGVPFTVSQLESYFTIYGFGAEPSDSELIKTTAAAFQSTGPQRWANAVEAALQRPHPSGTINYLAEIGSPMFLEQARFRLKSSGQTWNNDFYSIEQYWRALRPPDELDVLFAFYQNLRTKSDASMHHSESKNVSSRLILELCEEGYEPAWKELAERIHAKDYPGVSSQRRALPTPPTDEYAAALASWYPDSFQAQPVPGDWNELPAMLLNSVQSRPRKISLLLLQRMKNSATDENGKILAARYLFESTYRESEHAPVSFTTKEIGDFLYKETRFAVNDEHSLFESVLEALELECNDYRAGQGVEAFWNHDDGKENRIRKSAKDERLCHDALWKNLRTRLSTMGISGVRERTICDGFADFWCELNLPDRSTLKLPIELKVTAKGKGKPWLVDSMETQLFKKYMQPEGCRFGIFIVLWFQSEEWPHPSKSWTIERLSKEHRLLAETLNRDHGVQIEPLIIDLTTRTNASLRRSN